MNAAAWAPDALNTSNGIYGNLHDPTANPATLDPSMFGANNIDFNQLQNASLQQRLQNGSVRNASPAAFQNTPYQVNPIVPSKRPRPRDDSTGASPRQAPGSISLSRSQTPQQVGYPGFHGQHGGQPMQAPTPYQHLQRAGSNNATPSPTMQDSQFRPPGAPPRMQTSSPNPFPQQQQQQGLGMSPSMEQMNRANAQNATMAQMGGMNFAQGSPIMPGYSQNYGSMPQMSSANLQPPLQAGIQGVNLSQHLQARQAEAQRQYQIRLQQQQQQLAQSNIAAAQHAQQVQQRFQAGGINPMMASPAQQHNMSATGGMQPGQQQMPTAQRNNSENFNRAVASFMQSQGLGDRFDPNPSIAGRPLNLANLYALIMRQKGSQRVTQMNMWPSIAQALGFPPAEFPMAPQEMKYHYEKNVAPYELAQWNKAKMHQMLKLQQQAQMAGMTGMGGPQQMSPTKQMPAPGQNLQAQQQQYLQQLQQRALPSQQPQPPATPAQSTPLPNSTPAQSLNGWSTPQADPAPSRQQSAFTAQNRRSMSRQLDATPPQVPGQQPRIPSASPGQPDVKHERQPSTGGSTLGNSVNGVTGAPPSPKPLKYYTGPNYTPKKTKAAEFDTYGGISVADNMHSLVGLELHRLKPVIPGLDEMGLIDVRALSMSLQSGIHGEMRYALDHLVKLSHDSALRLELEKCEDLIDILIDCAEEQVDALAEDAAEVSDILDLTPYEDVIRSCRAEVESLQDIPEFGSHAYDLDRAADRLIAITTILRNVSFFEFNHVLLSSPPVIKFLSNTIRLLGTRNMLLRTYTNTQDFMKDMITFLSNAADKIELPSREEAHNILHFLLSFAPTPAPLSTTTTSTSASHSAPLRFTPYNPTLHRYLPPALDALAKLLARDDPNRHHYRALFAADATSHPPHDLLTRAFALAVSIVPDRAKSALTTAAEMRVVEIRKPSLMQGMLAADILASLAPGPESGLARRWLGSEDGWAKSLVRLCTVLTKEGGMVQQQMQAQQQQGGRGRVEDQGFGLITHRALGMLRRLEEKSGDGKKEGWLDGEVDGEDGAEGEEVDEVVWESAGKLSLDVVPKREVLMGAMVAASVDGVALRLLCKLAGMGG
ncbi:hypothetical protein H2201_003407 [Coniosporium apollinis]|uniref:ARID domain-containing protein n=2 Tax=Coniosporium TaxID=2810619 RepID=A0ABQ9NVS6_9PEZI|nr:hypothetical protein H2201_003407 [Coniosporium apollinis]